ncbi:MAG: transglycosylase domain-containing protein [Desulfomonile sp.]|nr:transglycosylase domain-containing protein [Desulfomonile sp.]
MTIGPKKILRALFRVFLGLIVILVGYLVVLTCMVVWAFEAKLKRWPTFVYCAPFTLRIGDDIEAVGLFERLKRSGYVQSSELIPAPGEWMLAGSTLRVCFTSCPLAGQGIVSGPVEVGLDWKTVQSIKLLRSQDEVNRIVIEPELLDVLPAEGSSRDLCRPLPLKEIKPLLVDAIIQTEDPLFFGHSGVDMGSMVEALKANYKAGRYVQGASTVTQQLIRMTLLEREKNLWRKINEIVLALLADTIYDKERILEAYLNRVYFGHWGAFSVNGVAEASRVFFGVDQSDLDPAQCALLAAIIRAPNVINPYRHPARAVSRRNMVLGLLFKSGRISREEYDIAIGRPARMRRWEGSPVRAPAFLASVKERIDRLVPDATSASKQYDVVTSLDPSIQEKANIILKRICKDATSAHLIFAAPDTGVIEALITPPSRGWSGDGGGFEAVAPLATIPVLSNAKQDSAPYSLGAPVFLPDDTARYITFRAAFLARRDYLLTRIIDAVGSARVQEVLAEFGVVAREGPSKSIIVESISPMRMAEIYAALATLGNAGVLHPRVKILGTGTVESPADRVRSSTSPAVLFLVNRLLKPVDAIALKEGRPDRSETVPSVFTAFDNGGIWSVAYRSDALCLIRIPATDMKPEQIESLVAGILPSPGPLAGRSGTPPEGIVTRKICAESGLLATSLCPKVLNEPFVKGTQPTEWCPLRHR